MATLAAAAGVSHCDVVGSGLFAECGPSGMTRKFRQTFFDRVQVLKINWFQLVSTGFNWFQLVSTGFNWFQLVSTGFNWFQLVSRLCSDWPRKS